MKFRSKIFFSYLIITAIFFTGVIYLITYFGIHQKTGFDQNLIIGISFTVITLYLIAQYLVANSLDKAFNNPITKLTEKVARLKKEGLESYKITTEVEKHSLGDLSNTIDNIILDLKEQKQKLDAAVLQKNTEIEDINKKLKVQEGAAINVFTELKEIDRMKTEFISLASHQLRTPLVAMKWGLQALLSGDKGELNEKQKEYTQDVFNSNNRMIALVNGLLNVSRIESGRIAINPKEINLIELVQDVIKELNVKLQNKNQTLEFNTIEKTLIINTDPDLLRHVYTNLITNAIKYSPKDSKIIVEVKETEENQILSSVQDFGYGIPSDAKAKIFGKFFRASNTRKIETDGTGLGLYLAKSIVELMGGTIWFESEENKGTTFWFTHLKTGVLAKEGEVSVV